MLAGQPLALYCTFSLDRSKPVTGDEDHSVELREPWEAGRRGYTEESRGEGGRQNRNG